MLCIKRRSGVAFVELTWYPFDERQVEHYMNTREDKARELFASGFNCAQAVLGAFCESEGLDMDTAMRLSTGFGGGVRCGEICGAVTGAVMVIGLKHGAYGDKTLEQNVGCRAMSYEFVKAYKEENNSILCRELLGVDIRAPEDHNSEQAKESHKKLCPELVASAVQILEKTREKARVLT